MKVKELLSVLDCRYVQVYRYTTNDHAIWEDNIERIDNAESSGWLDAKVTEVFILNEIEYNATIHAAEDKDGDPVSFKRLFGSDRVTILVIMVDKDWNQPFRRIIKILFSMLLPVSAIEKFANFLYSIVEYNSYKFQ